MFSPLSLPKSQHVPENALHTFPSTSPSRTCICCIFRTSHSEQWHLQPDRIKPALVAVGVGGEDWFAHLHHTLEQWRPQSTLATVGVGREDWLVFSHPSNNVQARAHTHTHTHAHTLTCCISNTQLSPAPVQWRPQPDQSSHPCGCWCWWRRQTRAAAP